MDRTDGGKRNNEYDWRYNEGADVELEVEWKFCRPADTFCSQDMPQWAAENGSADPQRKASANHKLGVLSRSEPPVHGWPVLKLHTRLNRARLIDCAALASLQAHSQN
jgi:hypothetical protein